VASIGIALVVMLIVHFCMVPIMKKKIEGENNLHLFNDILETPPHKFLQSAVLQKLLVCCLSLLFVRCELSKGKGIVVSVQIMKVYVGVLV
jgi:formate/nitrite transporter FocA (FNT family)